jgi:hypothetical protein
MNRNLHPDWESWWKGWLVAAPVVGYGSSWLAKNQLFRIWKVSRGIADGTTLSEARKLGLDPPAWEGAMWYGVAALAIFSLFYALAAKTWMQHLSDDSPS